MCRPKVQLAPGRADRILAVARTLVSRRGAPGRAAAAIACAWLLCAQPHVGAQSLAAPGPIQILDVPYISQTEALCGGAAAAMVLRFWGERGLTAESFATLVDDSASGIRTTTLIDDLRRRGWNANGVKGSDAILLRELERGRPTMVLIEDRPGSFHYVVVVASLPSTVVLHDPARAPFRVMARDEFARRWEAADRWVAVVVPDESRTPSAPAVAVIPVVAAGSTECQTKIATASRLAGEGAYDAAEHALTDAPACSAAVTFRELAGVRAVQKRWAEATELAQAAVDADRSDPGAWRLLGTSLFLQDDRRGALRAWNEVGEPRLDTLQIEGLVRTRAPVAERAARIKPGDRVTLGSVLHVERRLDAVPSISRAQVEYVPRPGGLADVRARVTDRMLFPRKLVAIGVVAAPAIFNRTISVPISSMTGSGERIDLSWRYQARRPRVTGLFTAPAPWGGVWGVGAGWERQPFATPIFPTAERTSARALWRDWVTPYFQLEARGGGDRWAIRDSALGTAGLGLLFASPAQKLRARVDLDSWMGQGPFNRGTAVIDLASSTAGSDGWSRARPGPD